MAERESSLAAPPQRILGLSPGVLLFVALAAANASNYLFQVVMSRQMGPRLYSLLGGVYAVITVVGVSTSALQTAAAKGAASTRTGGREPGDPLLRITVRISLVVTVLLLLASPLISTYLRSGIGPAVSLSLYVLPAAVLAIAVGRLQGAQAFAALAGLSLFLALGRLVLGPLALAVGLGVTSIVLVSVVVSLAGAWWGLRRTRDVPRLSQERLGADVRRAGCAVLLFWAMVSIDVPHARNALPELVAGQYAAGAAIGKAVLWLPGAVSLVLFPRVVSLREEDADPFPTLVKALGAAVALAGSTVLGLFLLGERLLPVFFGPEYGQAAALAWKVGLACVPFALVNVLVFYHLTRVRSRFLIGLAVALVLEVVALQLAPDDPVSVCVVIGGTGTALLAALTLPGVRRRLLGRAGSMRQGC